VWVLGFAQQEGKRRGGNTLWVLVAGLTDEGLRTWRRGGGSPPRRRAERERARAGDVNWNRRRGKTDEGLGTWRLRERERVHAGFSCGLGRWGRFFSCFFFYNSSFYFLFDLCKEYYVPLKKKVRARSVTAKPAQ